MNVSTAKAPFSFETISEMMLDVALELDCADDIYMNNLTESDIPTIYTSCLAKLMAYNHAKPNITVATKLQTIEYCIHVAIIFNETLLNSNVFINCNNIAMHETNLWNSLLFFENWYKCSESDNFLPQIMYNNLCMTVCGFIAYARQVILNNNDKTNTVIYVPALHFNTSTLESWFSLVWSMHKDSTCDYTTAVSTWNAASGIDTIKGQQNKSYCASDLAQQQHHDWMMLEQTFSHNDTVCVSEENNGKNWFLWNCSTNGGEWVNLF